MLSLVELFLQLTALKSALKNLLKEQDFFFTEFQVIYSIIFCAQVSYFLGGNSYSKGCCLNFLVTMPVSEKNTFCIFLCSLIVLKHISSLAIKLSAVKEDVKHRRV